MHKVIFNDYIKIIENDLRVNVIGFNQKGLKNEANIKISKNQISKRYSLNKNKYIYRIEFYKDDNFIGMIRAEIE